MSQSLFHSIAAHESWANTPDRAARTAPGRRAFLDKFEQLVDPDGQYPPDVRAQMAASARSAHFRRLAARSVAARRAKRGGRDGAT